MTALVVLIWAYDLVVIGVLVVQRLDSRSTTPNHEG